MIVKPTVQELLEHAENRYELVIATSRRAREIAKEMEEAGEKLETSTVTLAANEMAEGKVYIVGRENNEEDVENKENKEEQQDSEEE